MGVEDSKRRLMWHGMLPFLTGRTPGRRHERDFPRRIGRDLAGGETLRASEGRGVLERVVRHIRQLGRHHAGGSVWCGKPFPNYGCRPRRSALAGDGRDGRLHDGRDSDNCRFRPCPVGIAARRGFVRAYTMKAELSWYRARGVRLFPSRRLRHLRHALPRRRVKAWPGFHPCERRDARPGYPFTNTTTLFAGITIGAHAGNPCNALPSAKTPPPLPATCGLTQWS
jgi:hypothetical protein